MFCPFEPRTTLTRGRAKPFCWVSVAASTVTKLTRAQFGRCVLHGEVHRNRLASVGEARTHVLQRQHPAVGEAGRGVLGARECVEAQRLDPEPGGVDDVEDHRTRVRHLPGHRVGLGDDAGDGRDQGLGLLADAIQGGTTVHQTLQLGLRVVQLDLRDRAARRQLPEAFDAAFHDGDLLVQLPLALSHVGDVHRLDGRGYGR